VRDPFGFCLQTALASEGIARIQAGPVAAHLVHHPDLVHQVLVDNARNYIKGTVLNPVREALGNGLFTADGEEWLRQRRWLQPAFTAAHRDHLNRVASDVLTEAVSRWHPVAQRDGYTNLLADTIRLNSEIVLRTVVGKDFSATEHAVLASLIDRVFLGMTSRVWTLFLPRWLPVAGRSAYRRTIRQLDTMIYGLIAERRTQPATARDDLLGLLLHTGPQPPMSDQQIRDEIFTMFLAGNESTATTLTWTVYLLTQHPAILQQVTAELDEVLGRRIPTLDDIAGMPYLDRVIKEGARLFPAFPMYFRTALDTDHLGPYLLPAGAYVILSPYATHHDPRYWWEPERFDPDRFTAERFTPPARRAYYPFGAGHRRCPGEPISEAISKLLLATLLSRFTVTAAPGVPVLGRYAMTYQPRGGLPVRLGPRLHIAQSDRVVST
jgi:cytochrome P450